MTQPKEITLATLGNGDLLACASQELRKICENIADPNIKTEAKRKLQINIEIKPDAKGQMAEITYEVKTVLPGAEAGRTVAYIAMAPGASEISLYEVESQPPLFPDDETGPVTQFPRRA